MPFNNMGHMKLVFIPNWKSIISPGKYSPTFTLLWIVLLGNSLIRNIAESKCRIDTSTAKADFLLSLLLLRTTLQNSRQKPPNDDLISFYLPRINFQVIKQCSSKSSIYCSYPTWIWLKILRGFGQKLCYSFISNINFLKKKRKSTMNIKKYTERQGEF